MSAPGLSLNISPRLLQKQQLSLEMQLGFKLLQMSRQELEAYLEEQAETNPFLELERLDPDAAGAVAGASHTGIDFSQPALAEDQQDWLERMAGASTLGIYEALQDQIQRSGWPDVIRRELEQLLPHLDQHGFLPVQCPIAGWTQDQYDDAVLQFQRLEPAGVGARSVQESLLLQAAAEGLPELVDTLISEHLQDVAHGNIDAVMEALHCSAEELREAVVALRQLSPYPLNMDTDATATYTAPDVVVEKRSGVYEVVGALASHLRPRILNEIDALLKKPGLTKEQKSFLREQKKKAQHIMNFCDMREQTIARVARVLVNRQSAFLEHGPSRLKPLSLKEVAEELGVHESTVSRATAGKTMLTDRGLIALKDFFVQRVTAGAQDTHSPAGHQRDLVGSAVREALKQILDHEQAERSDDPYSDQELVSELGRRGMAVARRTVAKYRDLLEIPGRPERRRAYKLKAFTAGKP